jgi:tetratricopeptide (TPR) repeat protein
VSSIDEMKSELNWMIQNGQMSAALSLAERIKDETPDDPYTWLDYAMLIMTTGNREGAMIELRALVKAHPHFSYGWHNLFALLVSEDLVEAEKVLRRAIQLDPNDATMRMNLGYLFYRTNRTKAAIRALRKSIRMDPSAEACYNLGRILQNERHIEEARKYLEQALSLNPRFTPAQDALDEIRGGGE